jgi:hypothetical protein
MFVQHRRRELGTRVLAALSRTGDPAQGDLYRELLFSNDPDQRRLAVEGLARIADASMLPAFKTDFQREKNSDVRMAYGFGIVRLGDRAFLDSLVLALGGTGQSAQHARDLILELGPSLAPDLYPYLNDRDPSVRGAVCDLLAALGDTNAGPKLTPLLADPTRRWPIARTARSRSCGGRGPRRRARETGPRPLSGFRRAAGGGVLTPSPRAGRRATPLSPRRARCSPSAATTTRSRGSATRRSPRPPTSPDGPGRARRRAPRCRSGLLAARRPLRGSSLKRNARSASTTARWPHGPTTATHRCDRRAAVAARLGRGRRASGAGSRSAGQAGPPVAPAPDPLVDRVITSYGSAMQSDPSGAQAGDALIAFATRVGRLNEADATFQELVRRRREDQALLVRYGDFLAGPAGKPEAALAQYAQALIWKPDDTATKLKMAEIHLAAAAAYLRETQYIQAEARLKEARRYAVDPGSPQSKRLVELEGRVREIRGR